VSATVVARYVDGRLLKGISMDVDPNRPSFHVRPPDGSSVSVDLADLKALFFVRTLEGDSTRAEKKEADPADPRARGSTLVSLRFADGEEMVGWTIRFPPNRPYFFIVPVDTTSNNIRILVNRAAVTSMDALPLPPAM
jgi:hypothetical protein